MKNQVVFVPLSKCRINRYQVEGVRDEQVIADIKQSVLLHQDNGSLGLAEFPVARLLTDGNYELAFGRHRFYAFEELIAEGHDQFFEIPLIVRELTDKEMHELMGIEMLQHRTVSPIEEAMMFDSYMTQFNVTSAACAEKFNKSDEYIRQSVRLLNLPTSALDLIRDGTLTKTNGREMLSLLKIGGDDLVEEVVKEVLSEGVENFADVVETQLINNDAEYLDSSQKWFAMGKNFPHKHLSVVSHDHIESTAEFIENINAKEKEQVLDELQRLFASGMEVTQDSFSGWLSERSIAKLRVLQNPPACSGCPFLATVKGSHYCAFGECLSRKREAWEKHEIEKEANDLGVPMYAKADGKYFALDHYNSAHTKIWITGGADLRLMAAKNQYANFEGVGPRLKVVVVGGTAEKMLNQKEKLNEQNQESDSDEAREKEERKHELNRIRRGMREQAMLKFGWDIASFAFTGAMEGVKSVGLLEFICDDLFLLPDFPDDFDFEGWRKDLHKMKSAEKSKQLRRLIVRKFIEVGTSSLFELCDSKTAVLKYCDEMEALAKKIEVKLPKDFRKQAEKYQKDLDIALKEVK